jgi:lysozyme family protein
VQSTYEQAITKVFEYEGGYSNDKGDPGGPTNWGITIYDARQYWKPKATATDVKNMPKSVAEDIYLKHYATPLHYNDLPPGVDFAVLDYGINSGTSRAIKTLQQIVGTTQDGIIGPSTLHAVSQFSPIDIINRIYDSRIQFLQRLTTYAIFGRGWNARCQSGRLFAIKLLNETSPKEIQTQMTTSTTTTTTSVATTQSAGAIVIGDIEQALTALNQSLPGLLAFVGMFYAPAAAFAKFLPLIQVALTGVETVAQATGVSVASATTAVENHLTPGAANAPALNG